MTSFTYEYTVENTAASKLEADSVEAKVNDPEKVAKDTLPYDLARGFQVEGYLFNNKDPTEVKNVIQAFQVGTDTYQQVLMSESQGLLKESAMLVGGGMLRRKFDVLLYAPLPNGKYPKPQQNQIYVRRVPNNENKLEYIYMDPNHSNKVLGATINEITLPPGVLTYNAIEVLKNDILEKIYMANNITHYSDNITILGSEITYSKFAKGEKDSITLSGSTLLYGYQNHKTETFLYKPVGQPLQELSIEKNKNFFEAIEKVMTTFNDEEFSKTGKPRPLVVEYAQDDETMKSISIEPVLLLENQSILHKGSPRPDNKMKITTNDPDSNILFIHNANFNEQSKIYFDQVKQLDQMVTEATKIQDSVQKWRGRLGSFLGELIGGQKKLDKIMDRIKGSLTDDFLNNTKDQRTFSMLYNLPLGDKQQAVVNAEQVMLYPPPYPPLIVPTNQPGKNQLDFPVSTGPAGIAPGQEPKQEQAQGRLKP